jgi:hypothetical protein
VVSDAPAQLEPGNTVQVEARILSIDRERGLVVLGSGARAGLFLGLELVASGPGSSKIKIRITSVSRAKAIGTVGRPLLHAEGWLTQGALLTARADRTSAQAAMDAHDAGVGDRRRVR